MSTRMISIAALSACLVVVAAFVVSTQVAYGQPAPATQPAVCPMKGDPNNCPCMKDVESALATLADAKKAADSGDAKAASAAIDKAVATLKQMQANMQNESAKAQKVSNTRCPIMGLPIDPAKVPENLTRMYKGQKIGFCCAMCPAKWDKLSDREKEAKLAKVR